MAYVDSTTNSGSSATPIGLTPIGVVAGVEVYLLATIDSSTAAFDTADWPSGFLELAESRVTFDGQTSAIAWKRATGTETAGASYTFGNVGASGDWLVQAIALSGRHATDPPVVSATSVLNTAGGGTSVTVTANGVTALAGDDLLWFSAPDVNASGAGNGHTPPAGYTEAEDAENLWVNASIAYQENVAAGATGTVSGTFAYTANAGYVAWLVRVPAAAAGGTDATATAPAPAGTGTIPPPALAAAGTITGIPAAGVGDLVAPAVSATGNGTIAATPGAAAGDVAAPAVSVSATVVAVPMTGTGDLASNLPVSSEVVTTPLAATGDLVAPAVSSASSATVAAVPAAASGDTVAPTVGAAVTVTGPAAAATGGLLVPFVATGSSVNIQPPAAAGSGDIVAPTQAAAATVGAPPATGIGAIPVPAFSAPIIVATIPAAAAGALAGPTATGASTILPAAAFVTGEFPSPLVSDGSRPAITLAEIPSGRITSPTAGHAVAARPGQPSTPRTGYATPGGVTLA